jgi:molybdopterin-guanine dinucleotide biosynthesis protein A
MSIGTREVDGPMPEGGRASEAIVGVVLAGGLGRRMGGGDKPLHAIGGRPMLAHVIDRLAPQVERIVINANGDPARFAAYGLPVVPDPIAGFLGPLAGILAGMRWSTANALRARLVASVAGDTPFFPADLVARLAHAQADRRDAISLAASAGGTHPVFGLWPVALADELEAFLKAGDTRKILAFVDRHTRIDVPFEDIPLPDGETADPFFNVNTPQDARRAEEIATAFGRVAA